MIFIRVKYLKNYRQLITMVNRMLKLCLLLVKAVAKFDAVNQLSQQLSDIANSIVPKKSRRL
ncbi:MAG: hypothetical protein ACLR43_09555 [Faecalibacillus faecis]